MLGKNKKTKKVKEKRYNSSTGGYDYVEVVVPDTTDYSGGSYGYDSGSSSSDYGSSSSSCE